MQSEEKEAKRRDKVEREEARRREASGKREKEREEDQLLIILFHKSLPRTIGVQITDS